MNNVNIIDAISSKAPQATTYTRTEVDDLLDEKEPSFTGLEPLQKLINLPSGTFSIGFDTMLLNPYWVAGRITGVGNASTKLISKGRYDFTFTPDSMGYYRIDWVEPHPDGDNFVCLEQGEAIGGSAWNIIHNANSTTANGSKRVYFIVRDNNFSLIDGIMNFAILA